MSAANPNTPRRQLIALPLALAATTLARAQPAYPTKPITLIVPFAPGGIADLTARTVAQAMSPALKQPIVVDNRPSAGSIVGSAAVAKAAPDGYTLLLMSNANAVSAGLFRKLPFDAMKDFAPIGTLGFFDLALFVSGESKLGSVKDFVDRARAQPGKLTIGTIAPGSTQHLAAELFRTVAGIDVLVVPYKGSPAVLTALRAGEIDVAFEILGPMLGQVSAKAVRALAVTSDQRNPALLGTPTVKESGIADYAVASWNALAAPAGTPEAIVQKLNAAARDAVRSDDVRKRLVDLGVRPQAGTPAELRALLLSETMRWGEVIRRAGIELQ